MSSLNARDALLNMVCLEKCSPSSLSYFHLVSWSWSMYSYKGRREKIDDKRLYLNTVSSFAVLANLLHSVKSILNIPRMHLFLPLSVVYKVSSVQSELYLRRIPVSGSGKSHTVSTILENMLISGFSAIGSLAKPLSGLVLHYGAGGLNSLPNETAWLSSSLSSFVNGPPVRVYVSRASLQTMQTIYKPLGEKVTVKPLLFQNHELDAAAILSMMAVGSAESAPLYMQIILVLDLYSILKTVLTSSSSLYSGN